MIRTAVLGRGMAGRVFHAPLIGAVPELDLVAVAGRADAASLIADPAIDLIVIATPNDSHVDLAEQALRAGKHVVIDKPFALDLQSGERIVDLAQRQDRVLTVFHNRRWDGDFLTVRAILAAQRLGTVQLFEAHWDRFRPQVPDGWREEPSAGAGTLWNLGPHLVDQMLVLFGMPDAVQADISAQRAGARVDDFFALTFHFGAMRVVLSASNLIASPRPRFGVHGTAGSFVKFGLDPQEAALAAGSDQLDDDFGVEPDAQHGTLTLASAPPELIMTERGRYLEFYRQVAGAIRDGAALPVRPADALAGVRLINAAQESAEQGKLVATDRQGAGNGAVLPRTGSMA
ncbi:Gfo/Idh/MocA family oxidoreductase [Tsuneonella sp. HG222]